MRHLVLDIETIPDPAFPPPDPEHERIPPPALNRIVAIGCLLLENYTPKKIGLVAEGKSEREMIADLVGWLDTTKPTVVTWNGRSYDMPAIAGRALRAGVTMSWWFSSKGTRYRYSADGHFDVMDFLSDHGATKSLRLDHAARLVGFPGKVGTDGSQVGPMLAEGKLREVGSYCLCDVVQTAALFLRVELLRGEVDRATFLGLGRKLLDFIDSEPRLEAVAGKIDRPMFLLEEPVVREVLRCIECGCTDGMHYSHCSKH